MPESKSRNSHWLDGYTGPGWKVPESPSQPVSRVASLPRVKRTPLEAMNWVNTSSSLLFRCVLGCDSWRSGRLKLWSYCRLEPMVASKFGD